MDIRFCKCTFKENIPVESACGNLKEGKTRNEKNLPRLLYDEDINRAFCSMCLKWAQYFSTVKSSGCA